MGYLLISLWIYKLIFKNSMVTSYLSDKIRLLSFFSIILVLYIHSGFHDYPHEIQGMTFNFKLQEFVSGMLGRCAVPLFFAISGYLFFQGVDKEDTQAYAKLWMKIRKRIRTLLVPYLIACLFPAVFYLVLEYIPGVDGFMNTKGFSDNFEKPLLELIYFLFWDAGNGSPYAFQLWFLRDLILIVVLSPLLYMMSKWMGKTVVCGLFFVLSFFSIPILPVYGIFWFLLGGFFLDKFSDIQSHWIPLVFLLLSVFEMFFQGSIWDYLQIPIILLGILSFWTLYDKLVPATFELSKHKHWMILCSFTFFIYLYHEPTLNVVRKLLVLPFPHSSFGFAFSYMVSPWLFAWIWVGVGIVFKRLFPRIYGICMGGR